MKPIMMKDKKQKHLLETVFPKEIIWARRKQVENVV